MNFDTKLRLIQYFSWQPKFDRGMLRSGLNILLLFRIMQLEMARNLSLSMKCARMIMIQCSDMVDLSQVNRPTSLTILCMATGIQWWPLSPSMVTLQFVLFQGHSMQRNSVTTSTSAYKALFLPTVVYGIFAHLRGKTVFLMWASCEYYISYWRTCYYLLSKLDHWDESISCELKYFSDG